MEYAKPFLIGGSIIAASKYASKFVAPQYGSLVSGIPMGMIASYFISGEEQKKHYYNGYIYVSISLFVTILFINLCSHNTTLRMNIIISVGIILWAVLGYTMIQLRT